MPTRSALLLLGVLLLSPPAPAAHAQGNFRPHRTMQPFASDAELLRYLAAIDRTRRSRRTDPGPAEQQELSAASPAAGISSRQRSVQAI